MNQGERLLELVDRAAVYYSRLLASDSGVDARSFLTTRGISLDTCERFRVGSTSTAQDSLLKLALDRGYSLDELIAAGLALPETDGQPERDRYVRRVVFPIADAFGRTIGFGARSLTERGFPKYLNSSDGPLFKKGSTLYGLHLARTAIDRHGCVILVEGFIDALAVAQFGFNNVVATMGTAVTKPQLERLATITDRAVFLFDGDEAGVKAAERASAMADSVGITARAELLPDEMDPAQAAKERPADLERAIGLPLLARAA